MPAFINLVGKRFGRLTVVERIGTKNSHPVWLCTCLCGREAKVTSNDLRSGKTLSCGCLRREQAAARSRMGGLARGKQLTKHGKSGTRLYNVWKAMRERCNNPRDRYYADYGGRGIRIAAHWNDYENFHRWAMRNGYDPAAPFGECTIDRIDVSGNYCPENCRWTNMDMQAKNRRPRRKEA